MRPKPGVQRERRPWSAGTEKLLELALREDLGSGDVTTELAVAGDLRGSAAIVAREAGVLAGVEVARWVFARLDASLAVDPKVGDGGRFEGGQTLVELAGHVAPMLSGERLALNFLQRLSGIATLTREFVDALAGTGVVLLDTRKTIPGWRELERAAVRAGGGTNHRAGLYDAILLKENHVRAAGGIESACRAVAPRLLQIEVRSLDELLQALSAGARSILLDNFSAEYLAQAVRVARSTVPAVVLEASGGIGLHNVREIAETGVDRISIGALTHSARAIDLSLLLGEVDTARRP